MSTVGRLGATVGGLLLGAGALLLFGLAWVRSPWVADPGLPLAALSVTAAGGLGLMAAGSVALAVSRRDRPPGAGGSQLIGAAAAASAPAAVMLVVLLRSGGALISPDIGSPPVDRMLLAGAALAAIPAPVATWFILLPTRQPWAVRLRAGAEMMALGLIALVFAGTVALGIAQAAPFSWDEAVYALTTRHWVQDGPVTGWGAHRPPALSALGVIPIVFGTDEMLFRVIGLAFGCVAVVGAWFLARSLAGPLAGLLAAVVVAASPTFQIDAGLLLNDIPAAGLVVWLMALLWRFFEGGGPVSWRILWLAPLAAAAFYLRYGTILALVSIGLAVLIVWPDRVLRAWRQVGATVLLLLVLLVPHGIFAVAQTGSPLGVFLLAQGGASGAALGAGLRQYAAWLPWELAGPVGALLAVVGLLGAVHRLVTAAAERSWDPAVRATTLLVVAALFQVMVLGLFQLAQWRYLFLPMMLLVAAGAAVLVDSARRRGRPGALGVAAVGLVAAGAMAASTVIMPGRADARSAGYEWLRDVGAIIREQGEGSCSVLASDFPQITWYSGCPTYNFAGGRAANRDGLLTGEHRFLVVRPDGRFQPGPELMAEYLLRVEPDPVAVVRSRTGAVRATLYRFR